MYYCFPNLFNQGSHQSTHKRGREFRGPGVEKVGRSSDDVRNRAVPLGITPERNQEKQVQRDKKKKKTPKYKILKSKSESLYLTKQLFVPEKQRQTLEDTGLHSDIERKTNKTTIKKIKANAFIEL